MSTNHTYSLNDWLTGDGYDGNGSVRFLTDNSGYVTDTYDYDAFGNLINQMAAGTPTPNLFLYTGEQWDPDLGFYYLRARYSNPETGRFWNQDTFSGVKHDPATLHKYIYCHQNPVNLVDITGNYSSIRQYWGYKVEEALQEFYETDNEPDLVTKSARVFRIDQPARWLFPDIYNHTAGLWMEVKPLSPTGVISGEAKRTLNLLALRGEPDIYYVSPLIVEIATGEQFVTVNVMGVIYWVNLDEVERDLLVLITSGVAYTERELLRFLTRRAVSATIGLGLRPALGYATAMAGGARVAESGRAGIHYGIAVIIGLFGFA